MEIKVKEYDLDKARTLSERFGLDILTSSIATRRDLNESDMKWFLETDPIYRENPLKVEEVINAVERINQALEDEEIIMIFGDRDVDGVTATASLAKTLKKLGARNLILRLPEGDESYGLTKTIVKEALEKGVTLLITVDNGISAIDEIKELEKAGVSVIVTDHHIPNMELPPATSIIDPKIEGLGFSFDSYSGSSVSSLLCWALLFSKTELYESRVILLHSELANDVIKVSAVKLENLSVVDRISLALVPNFKSVERDRLLSFLSSSLPIVVFDKNEEYTLLRKAFGKNVDIHLEEFRPILERSLPRLANKSLFDLSRLSRGALYSKDDKELETLISLFTSLTIRKYPSLDREFREIYELETLGTIADIMPLVGENKLIVKHGLKLLKTPHFSPLSLLIMKQGIERITVRDISFKVSPVINAPGRMGHAEEALEFLLCEDEKEAKDLLDKLISRNKERQKIEEDVLALIKSEAKKSFEEFNSSFIFIEDERIPRGLTGAISNKLLSEFSVTSLVIARSGDKSSGSVRSKDINVKDFLQNFSYLLEDYGGHKAAGGFSLDSDNIDNLKSEIVSYLSKIDLKNENENKEDIEIDATIPESLMSPKLWEIEKLFSPFGNMNPPLSFYIKDAVIETIYPLSSFSNSKGKFLRGTVRIGLYAWPFVWWDVKEGEKEFRIGERVNFVFSPEVNSYRGIEKLQLNVTKMEKSN